MLKELLEDLQQPQQDEKSKIIFQTDDFNEYDKALDKLSADRNRYHFEEVSPKGSDELFDIIVEVFDYTYYRGSYQNPEEHTIDWDVEYFGTGDFDEDKNFYIKQAIKRDVFPLDDDFADNLEESLIEHQYSNYEPETEAEYYADQRGEEDRHDME